MGPRHMVFMTLVPQIQPTLLPHLMSKNNDTPLLTMSTIRIIRGSTLQWLTPNSLIGPPITESTQSALPGYLIILRTLYLALIITYRAPQKLTALKNKFFSSIRFIAPLSTQLPLPLFISTSLKLYKHLDQT